MPIAKHVSKLIATGLYSGLSPKAPGTCGSIIAVFFLLLTRFLEIPDLAVLLASLTLGTLAVHFYISDKKQKDPQEVVQDEWLGIFIAMFNATSLVQIILAFTLFRLFDITKPPPISNVEKLPGAFGIMADDLLAGVFSFIILKILCVSGFC